MHHNNTSSQARNTSDIFRVIDAKFVGFPIGADRMALLTNQIVDQNSFL